MYAHTHKYTKLASSHFFFPVQEAKAFENVAVTDNSSSFRSEPLAPPVIAH